MRRFSFKWPSRVQWIARPWLQLVSALAVFERWLMTEDKGIRDEKNQRDEIEQDDPTIARRVKPLGASAEDPEPETRAASGPAATGGIVQQIWRRIQEERSRPKRAEINTRGQNNMDRSKAFLVLATAVVLIGFVFLALFSTSGAEKRAQERRTKPSLGRPESTAQQAGTTGSTVPLLSADQNGGDSIGDQLSPDDILATSRRTQAPSAKQPETKNQYSLSNVPPVNDPALDAYRRQHYGYAAPPAPPPPPSSAPQKEATSDPDGLKK